ncbi:hypothetical protein IT568_03110 [bacterium]|nr:hypothetical protein [bacterium]
MKTFLLIFFVLVSELSAQSLIEKLSEGQTVSEDFLNELYETCKEKPLKINLSTETKIKDFPFFESNLIFKILKLRKEKQFENFEDFALRTELDSEHREFLKPVLSFEKREVEFFSVNLRNRLTQNTPKTQGFKNGDFQGNTFKVYNRVEVVFNERFSAGFLADKDAGEKSFQDFRIAYVSAENLPVFQKTVLGNFKYELGQGLIWSAPYVLTKLSSAPVLSGNRKSQGVQPYKSSGEANEFFGAATTLLFGDFLETTLLFSDVKRDANQNENGKITSIDVSGLHRTGSELAKKDFLAEKMFGGNVTFRQNNFSFGTSVEKLAYSKDFESGKSKNLFLFGSNYTFDYGNLLFGGETAFNKNGKNGTVNSLTLASESYSSVFVYRRYEEGFENPNGLPFAEDFLSAEEGFYFGNTIEFLKTKVHFFTDIFRSLEVAKSPLFPEVGKEFSLEIEREIFEGIKLTGRLKTVEKETKITKEVSVFGFLRETEISSETQRTNLRFQFDFSPKQKFSLRTRFEKSFWKVKEAGYKEDGILVYQDAKFDVTKFFSANLRGIFFDTKGFESRIYEYERDFEGVLSNVGLSGQGVRVYFLGKFKFPYKTALSFKFAQTFHANLKAEKTGKDYASRNENGEVEIFRFPVSVVQGSGNNSFEGDSQRVFSVQLDFEF